MSRFPKYRQTATHEQAFFLHLKKMVHTNIHHRHKYLPLMRSFFFIVAYIICWSFLVFFAQGELSGILAATLLGILGTSLALNVGHEACHELILPGHPRLNAFFYACSMNMLGVSAYIWKIGHMETHHRYTNISQHDVGIEAGNILRISPHVERQSFHAYQHLYAPLLYCFYTLSWIFMKDFRLFFAGEQNGATIKKNACRLMELFLVKGLYVGTMILLPLKYSHYSPSQVLLGFVLMHVIFSLYIASLLFTSHINDQAAFCHLESEQKAIPSSYIHHQLETTVDISPSSKILSFLLGGFNTHAIHHLFPHVSAIYYPELTVILEKECHNFHMPYKKMSYFEGIKSHFRYLKKMGEVTK